jgi:hypothetical protein
MSPGTHHYRYLFGPVPSRRLGWSLGVDLTPPKTCSLHANEVSKYLGKLLCPQRIHAEHRHGEVYYAGIEPRAAARTAAGLTHANTPGAGDDQGGTRTGRGAP